MTSALKEIVDAYEECSKERHYDRTIGVVYDACEYCAPVRSLISRARAELERGVDVRLPIGLGHCHLTSFNKETQERENHCVRRIVDALRAQGVRVVEDGKEST